MQQAGSASDSERPTPTTRSRKPRRDLAHDRLFWSMGEVARAMGVDVKTARARLQGLGATEKIGRNLYTTAGLIRRYFLRTAPDLLARLQEQRDDEK